MTVLIKTNRLDKQRLLGQYMTTASVAEKMASLITGQLDFKIYLDPSCGDGNLLISIIDLLELNGIKNIKNKIVGIDIDPEMVNKAKERISKRLGCKKSELKIYCENFLDDTFTDSIAGRDSIKADVVLANPPYGKNREIDFFSKCNQILKKDSQLIFLVPLGFVDRIKNINFEVLDGRPLGVTTGHAIVRHFAGSPFTILAVKPKKLSSSNWQVLTGIKLYEVGAGRPKQTEQTLLKKPFSSDVPRNGWIPCLRSGDIKNSEINTNRLWVDYGDHLAHPKELDRFQGPKLFISRIPNWADKTLSCAYSEDTVLCAGDVLIVKHVSNKKKYLLNLKTILESDEVADYILTLRPSVMHRDSFPKISAKDIDAILNNFSETLEKEWNDQNYESKNKFTDIGNVSI